MKTVLSVIVSLTLLNIAFTMPRMRMRLCVASNNPYRLQNQCVYCHNKRFQNTVRVCTGTPYLPANVSLEEGFCMVRQCRAQMPLYKPEPFYQPPSLDLGDVNVGVNVDSLSVSPNAAPSTNIPAISYEEPSYAPAYLHQNSPGRPMNYMPPSGYIPTTIQPMRRRPAPIFVGRPVKPHKPFFMGR